MIDTILQWQWRHEAWLWLLWLPLIWWGLSWSWRRRRNSQYAQSHLLPWVKVSDNPLTKGQKMTRPGRFLSRFWQPKLLIALAWMGLVIALAGPRTQVPSPEETTRGGIDILVAIDTSRSMMAQDVSPNRFLVAKALVESLVNRLEPNDRVGLMVYAGKPHLVAPLSFDRDLFQYYLNLVRPGMLPTLGSQTQQAIEFGMTHLQQTAGKTPILLLFSDGIGQSTSPQNPPSFAGHLRIIGVGKPQPSVIPSLEHATGALHLNGLKIMTSLQQAELAALAQQWNGQYVNASESLMFLETLLADLSAQAPSRSLPSSQTVWEDHSKPFIGFAFLAFLWAFYPFQLRFRRKQQQSLLSLVGLMGISGLLTLSLPETVSAQGLAGLKETTVAQEQQAFDAFQMKQYDLAEQAYQQLSHFSATFGAGAAAYRKQDYESAVRYFQQAALQAETESNRALALFNLGNSFYQAGLFKHAVEAYQQALLYQTDYEKARHNLALAEKARQRQSGQQQNEEQGEGQGQGDSSRDNEGAFYGGQKPDPSAGEGASGDAPEGNLDGKEFVLPEAMEQTDFSLAAQSSLELNSTANAILDQQQRRHRIEQFEKTMRTLQDNQLELLKHLFEREEGFQARQVQPHPLPGVEPW